MVGNIRVVIKHTCLSPQPCSACVSASPPNIKAVKVVCGEGLCSFLGFVLKRPEAWNLCSRINKTTVVTAIHLLSIFTLQYFPVKMRSTYQYLAAFFHCGINHFVTPCGCRWVNFTGNAQINEVPNAAVLNLSFGNIGRRLWIFTKNRQQVNGPTLILGRAH